MSCKWLSDEFCTNSDCPYCADFCPVAEHPEICKWSGGDRIMTREEAANKLKRIEALKEPERKRGHWIRRGMQTVECSACGRRLDQSVYGYLYAPCCGAIMDEEAQENEG